MKKITTLSLLILLNPFTTWADDFYTFGAPDCGYGRYTTGEGCVEYGTLDSGGMCNGALITGGACMNAFIVSSAEIFEWYPFNSGYGDFGVSVTELSEVEKACGSVGVIGGACLNAFVESSNEVEDWYPFWGGFGDLGVASDIFETMLENVCMDGYYVTNAGDDMFVPLQNGECATGRTSFIVANDCQYIDTSSKDSENIRSGAFFDNYICGKLCDTDLIYTGTGACSQYCKVNGRTHRLFVGGEYEYSAPLYTDKLTSPAMAFRFNDGGSGQMCYMNLLPIKKGSSETKVMTRYGNKIYFSSY